MAWTVLIAPVAGLVGVLVGAGISTRAARAIHTEKVAFDREQTERKVTADIALAEKKLTFDKELATWRRRYELAEQVMTTAYEARDSLFWARAPVILAGEGQSRKSEETESEKIRERRNSYFIPVERLDRKSKTFATLQALRYAVAAHFGGDAVNPLGAIIEVHNGIVNTVGTMMKIRESASAGDDPILNQSLAPLRNFLGWGERPDDTDRKLNEAIEQIEAICKPVLSAGPPS